MDTAAHGYSYTTHCGAIEAKGRQDFTDFNLASISNTSSECTQWMHTVNAGMITGYISLKVTLIATQVASPQRCHHAFTTVVALTCQMKVSTGMTICAMLVHSFAAQTYPWRPLYTALPHRELARIFLKCKRQQDDGSHVSPLGRLTPL